MSDLDKKLKDYVPHPEAMAKLEKFIEEAQAALETLKNKQEQGDE